MNALAGAAPAAGGAFDASRLPRLLYFADVPVENYMHGSALIYRLLESYPADRLLIVESIVRADPNRRLADVPYRNTRRIWHRALKSRFAPYLWGAYALAGGDGTAALRKAVSGFDPQAVLTVVHGCQWLTAANFAFEEKLPLHVLAHDRWQDTMQASAAVKTKLAARFAAAYRGAESRFCVSSKMVDVYLEETGASAQVLYPARRKDFVVPAGISPRAIAPGRPFTVAYAGSIADQGLIEALELLRKVLAAVEGRLIIFGPHTSQSLGERGLAGSNLSCMGPVSPHELADRLGAEADLLSASVSFAETAREAMAICFPSKLTDYTAAGLPILIHGPPDSSAVTWARANPGVGEVVETMNESDLANAIARLMSDGELRRRLAQGAIDVGAVQFAGDAAERLLFQALARGRGG